MTDDDGYLYLVDRAKDLIIVSGFNVYPAEVEEVLAMHPGVDEVAVVGVPHPHTGEAVKAYVVQSPGARPRRGQLIAHCTAQPRPLQVPDQGPVRRRAAEGRRRQAAAPRTAAEAPATRKPANSTTMPASRVTMNARSLPRRAASVPLAESTSVPAAIRSCRATRPRWRALRVRTRLATRTTTRRR